MLLDRLVNAPLVVIVGVIDPDEAHAIVPLLSCHVPENCPPDWEVIVQLNRQLPDPLTPGTLGALALTLEVYVPIHPPVMLTKVGVDVGEMDDPLHDEMQRYAYRQLGEDALEHLPLIEHNRLPWAAVETSGAVHLDYCVLLRRCGPGSTTFCAEHIRSAGSAAKSRSNRMLKNEP